MNEIGAYFHGEILCLNGANFDKFTNNNFLEKSSNLRCSNSKNFTDIITIPLHMPKYTLL